MFPYADYHTHTCYSHGQGTVEENVMAARKKVLREIAITDHGPRHLFIGIKSKQSFDRMRLEVAACQKKYPDINVLLGVEANIISQEGDIDVSEDILPCLDLILVGYHLMVRTINISFTYHL